MTDQDILSQMQRALLETANGGTAMTSDLWTTAELVDAINAAQLWVVREGQPLYARETLITVPNQARYDLPQDWLVTRRVSWETSEGDRLDLPRDSSWSSDYLDADWTYERQAMPLTYTDYDTPMPQIQVMPAAFDTGLLHLLFVEAPATLSNSGIAWTIPDLLVPMAKWKALAILLAKDGRGQDLPRAELANTLAEQGMAALRAFLLNWT